MLSNLIVLQGPPKKIDLENYDLEYDYLDMKITRILKA
jgi:hypothetical protein